MHFLLGNKHKQPALEAFKEKQHLVSDEHGDDAAYVSLLPLLEVSDSCLLLKYSDCQLSHTDCLSHRLVSRQTGQPARQTDPGLRVAGVVVHV